jgi:uncharacterized protein YjbI with pentapeptide repeats
LRLWFRSSVRLDDEENAAPTVEREGTAEQADAPLSVHENLPAAEDLERMFPNETTPSSIENATFEENIAEQNAEEVPVNWDALPEMTIAPEPAKPSVRAEDLPSAAEALAEIFPAEQRVEPDSASQTAFQTSVENDDTDAGEKDSPDRVADAGKTAETEFELNDDVSVAATTPTVGLRAYSDWALEEKLASHREWVESRGGSGKQANLGGAQLEGTELIGVNLRFADLHDVNLKGADLLLADLRDSCLVRADLDDACLVGTNLEGANLEGASLDGAMGLVPRQLAGANLRDASLPEPIWEFDASTEFRRASSAAAGYFVALATSCVVSWLLIWSTKDLQLLTDSALLRFLHSRAAATAMPTAEFYLILPAVLFIVYLVFQFHLQRVWDAVMVLPAVFPDGEILGEDQPAVIRYLLRAHFRWINPDPSSTGFAERAGAMLLAYWMLPLTLLFFWARYLTTQEVHGSFLQAALFAISTGIATYATTRVGRPHEPWTVRKTWAHGLGSRLRGVNPVKLAAVLLAILMILCAGTFAGVPREKARAPRYGAASARRWVTTVFWCLGFDPYADLTEAALSPRPGNGMGSAAAALPDDQLPYVTGLRLNSVKFRYAQGYRAFLVNAHLWNADFQGAFLSEADLRGADLAQANLKFAILDGALMSKANFDRANLDGADLARADLRDANLPYVSLANATLADARLDGASFYSANLAQSTLTRASVQKADLRNARLGAAHLANADFRGAYLWAAQLPGADLGGAQLGTTILIDADMRGVNLSGAQAAGAVLAGANLSGAFLDGADFRGASGLTAQQVCLAKSRYGVLLDDGLLAQVQSACGGAR